MFILELETGNAAFCNEMTGEPDEMYEEMETERILYQVIRGVGRGAREGNCIDINGNKVGKWRFE